MLGIGDVEDFNYARVKPDPEVSRRTHDRCDWTMRYSFEVQQLWGLLVPYGDVAGPELKRGQLLQSPVTASASQELTCM